MLFSVLVSLALPAVIMPAQATDTTRIEVGSPLVDGRVYKPHKARVRVHLNSVDSPPTNEWTNELTIGDSAGRKVMRWVTLGQRDANGVPSYELRQTYDLITLAPMGYHLRTKSGNYSSLAISEGRMRGVKKLANQADTVRVDQAVPRLGYFSGASDLLPAAVGFKAGHVYIAPVWHPNMQQAENRIFSVIGKERIMVEGQPWDAWKVEERKESDRTMVAIWYLTDVSPYMVAGDAFLPNGQVQKMTEIAID